MQHAITFVIAALCILAIAYRLYGVFFVRKVLRADDKLVTLPRAGRWQELCADQQVGQLRPALRGIAAAGPWWARSWPPSTATCRASSGC